jgi:uncharacterized membrane protein YadS
MHITDKMMITLTKTHIKILLIFSLIIGFLLGTIYMMYEQINVQCEKYIDFSQPKIVLDFNHSTNFISLS